MQLNIDGIIGAIVSVSSGRIVIDFNHPLSGKILSYHMKVKKMITEKKEQVAKLFETYTNLESEKVKVEIADKTVKISYNSEKELNEKAKEVITEDIKKYTGFETVEITKEQLKSTE
jgi:FKBP-type peptidyl-prolyl cis-trans isomerase SlyD